MKILAVLVLVLEIVFIIHAVRNNRLRWIFFILLFPLVSCIVYAFVYVIPALKKSGAVETARMNIGSRIMPDREIERLKKQLAFSGTVKNRQLLAAEYMRQGQYAEAVNLYEKCTEGIYSDDPDMLLDLGRAHVYNKSWEKAKLTLLKINVHPVYGNAEVFLLLARAYEECGDNENALKTYLKTGNRCYGEEAKCRYAMLLKKTGQEELAREIFHEIAETAKHAQPFYRREQKEWIDYAALNLE